MWTRNLRFLRTGTEALVLCIHDFFDISTTPFDAMDITGLSHVSVQQQEPSPSPRSAATMPPVPRMDLVIPDIDDTIMDTVMDSQDKDEGWAHYEHPVSPRKKSSAVPVIIVSRIRAESGDYTNTWDVAREEDGDDGPSHT
jgi:hypothetical protein